MNFDVYNGRLNWRMWFQIFASAYMVAELCSVSVWGERSQIPFQMGLSRFSVNIDHFLLRHLISSISTMKWILSEKLRTVTWRIYKQPANWMKCSFEEEKMITCFSRPHLSWQRASCEKLFYFVIFSIIKKLAAVISILAKSFIFSLILIWLILSKFISIESYIEKYCVQYEFIQIHIHPYQYEWLWWRTHLWKLTRACSWTQLSTAPGRFFRTWLTIWCIWWWLVLYLFWPSK